MSRSVSFLATSQARRSQTGGVSIMVTLMMLVLLTVAALAMSRNSFREIVASGTARQGAIARNLADSGIEYGILWIQPSNLYPADPTNNASAVQLQSLATFLVAGELYGKAYKLDRGLYAAPNLATPNNDLQVPANSGNGFNIALTAMGKMPITNQSQTAGSATSGYTPASGNIAFSAPDLWAIRSDGVYNAAGVMKFSNSKEAWISSPPR